MDKLPAIAQMVRQSERHADDLSKDRLRAIEYYQGEMKDTPSDTGRSGMVSRDVRANIKKVLPSIMRTILNADEVVEFQPVEAGDEQGAEQSSDYMNFVVLPETNARDAIHDAIHDALLLRNGILKWWFEEKQAVEISKHSGLTEDALAQIIADDDIEVLEQSSSEENVEADGQITPVTLYSVKIRRTHTKKQLRCAAVPRERFLIHPDAVTLEDSPLTGEKTTITRSELVEMGYDREMVSKLTIAADDNEESEARRDVYSDESEAERANEPLDYYDIYLRVDMDDDGIAELRHMTFAGGLQEKNLLENDEVDEVQFCDVCVMRQPHQWEGISLADDLMDIQRGKTVLLRQTLDNIYWQNNPQPVMQDGAILNPEAVMNPEFGLPIRIRQGMDVRQALNFNQVPFVANDSFGMMEYLDAEAQDRTGVSDASAGLAPDALQNMTAKASAMIEAAGIGQTELMVKNVAEGLRKFFRGMLRLSIRHQDVPRTVRLRDEWVQIDPRHWNAAMDCTVNTGLGAGTRERDMQMMQFVIGMQEKLLAGFGPDNPFVKPENLHASASKLIESAGLKTPGLYITEPDKEEVEAKLKAAREQPNPEQMKMQSQMQLEQAKLQAQMQLEQAKLGADKEKAIMQAEVARDKEKAQMEADLIVSKAKIEADRQKQADKLQSDAILLDKKLEFEREKLASERQDAIGRFQAERINAQEDANNVVDFSEASRGQNPSKEIMDSIKSLSAMIEAQSGPKTVVRDDNGEVIGIQTATGMKEITRDDQGSVTGIA
ncbi:MAG: phage portal protein [Sulfitobacter sp.]